jgi:dynein heavy chain
VVQVWTNLNLLSAPAFTSVDALSLQVLSEIFLPLLAQHVSNAEPCLTGALQAEKGLGSSGSSSGRSRELLGSMHKYLAHVKQALQQLTGDVLLPMPSISIGSVAAASSDPDAIHTLEEMVADWSSTLSDVMQRESKNKPQGQGPLPEIDFWRARSAVFSGLWEQLNTQIAADTIAVVEATSDDRNLVAAFKAQLAELGKLAHEVNALHLI